MESEEVLKNCISKMKKAFDVFSQDLASLRTGRANASMLDIIKVDVYGQMMPINQLATISTPDARIINVQVWDKNNVILMFFKPQGHQQPTPGLSKTIFCSVSKTNQFFS